MENIEKYLQTLYPNDYARIKDTFLKTPQKYFKYPSLQNIAFVGALGGLAPTFSNDFSVDNMVDQDSANIGIDTGNSRLDFNAKRDGSNDSSSWDLETTLDDTAWLMDYELTYTTLTTVSTNVILYIGMSSINSATAYNGGAQDGIAYIIVWGSGNTHGIEDKDNAAFTTTTDANFSSGPSTIQYFKRTRRLTATTYDDTFYSDAARTTPVLGGTINGTCAATLVDLQYWKVGNFDSGSGNGVVIGHVKNLNIFDGVTSI